MNPRSSETYGCEYARNEGSKHIHGFRLSSRKKVELDLQKGSRADSGHDRIPMHAKACKLVQFF